VAALGGMLPGPAGAPLAYTAADHGGPEGGYLGVVRGGAVVPQTGVLVTDATTPGLVRPYPGTWQAAPASGVPSG